MSTGAWPRAVRGAALNTFLSAEDVPAAWDGWDVDADCMEKLRPDGVLQSRMVAADGPVEYRVRCTWTVRRFRCAADIIFHADSPLVEFDTELEWHGKHRL
ncbi:MAG: glycoside hydrolase family 38 C-terminal domain-containing protein [Ruthenibacterium lactatiformans]